MEGLTGRLETGTIAQKKDQCSRDNCAIFLSEIFLSEILSNDADLAPEVGLRNP
jgi:hypothetical protein